MRRRHGHPSEANVAEDTERNQPMKNLEHVKCVLAANRRLAHYKGVKVRDGKKDLKYDIISSCVNVFVDKDGGIVDPDDAEAMKAARTERHSVAFDIETWDAIAGAASVVDTVVVEGTLCIPERGEKGFYEVERADKSRFFSGDLRDPRPVGFVKGVFPGAKLKKASEIPVEGGLDEGDEGDEGVR